MRTVPETSLGTSPDPVACVCSGPPLPAQELKALQDTNPNYYTIAYINCSAAVKALSDVICTSGNAVKIVQHAPPDRDLLFVPDENLGAWVMEQTGRPMTLWRGNCYAHVEFTHASITRIRVEADGSFKVISVGDVGHIPPNLRTGASGDPERSLAIPAWP